MTDWLNVGKIVNTHGVHGEVRVISRTDFPEERYATGNILYAFNDKGESFPLTITSWRQHKQFDLLKFENYPNLTEVEKLKGLILKINRVNVETNLSDGEYFFHEIIGLTVYTEEGLELGIIKEILTPGANDVWVVKRKEKGKDLLIPYIDDVVKEIDLPNHKVIIHPMEGLLDI